MKECIFISDFDGTISKRDFYWIIIDDYIGAEGKQHYLDWKKNHKIGVTFLNKIFTWHKFTKEEHDDVISKVAIDKTLKKFKVYLKTVDCELIILSAGFRYYIDKVLEAEGLSDIEVITNEGVFEEAQFQIRADEGSWYYHELYGVDKYKVIKHYKTLYKTVMFAGDSEPDYRAAVAADIRFAKGELVTLLEAGGYEYYAFNEFEEVGEILKNLKR